MQRDPNPIHPNHLENRLLYAQRVLGWIDTHTPNATAANLAALNRPTWEHICRLAGEERMPSDATISSVVALARGRELAIEAIKGAYANPKTFLVNVELEPKPEVAAKAELV